MFARRQKRNHSLLGPVDDLNDPLGYVIVRGPTGEQVRGADCLGRLGEHGRSAGGKELVDGDAQGRIGGQPAGGVRPATLQGKRQPVEFHLGLLVTGRPSDHLLDDLNPLVDAVCDAGLLDHDPLERFPGAKVVGIDPDTGRVRVAARVAGRRGSIKSGSAPDIPAVSQPPDLAMMLDIVHYLNDEALRLTFKRLYDCLKNGRQLIVRASIPPTRKTPWVWWLENLKLKLNQTPSYYRSAETLQTMLAETDFSVDQTQPSGANGELVWLIATKKMSNERN